MRTELELAAGPAPCCKRIHVCDLTESGEGSCLQDRGLFGGGTGPNGSSTKLIKGRGQASY
eukprot:1157924-Pelagomonas_calceolata.AAC.2